MKGTSGSVPYPHSNDTQLAAHTDSLVFFDPAIRHNGGLSCLRNPAGHEKSAPPVQMAEGPGDELPLQVTHLPPTVEVALTQSRQCIEHFPALDEATHSRAVQERTHTQHLALRKANCISTPRWRRIRSRTGRTLYCKRRTSTPNFGMCQPDTRTVCPRGTCLNCSASDHSRCMWRTGSRNRRKLSRSSLNNIETRSMT